MNEVLLGEWNVPPLLLFTVFMLSQWGWWCFFGKHSGVNTLFLPSLTACFQITILVCMGMAGHLLLGSYSLLIFGVLYLPYAFVRRQHPFQTLSLVEVLFLLCTIVLIFLATRGKVLCDHDNFSHWGTVLKELLRTDHFPDRSRLMTEHFTYPLGSAVWIYFFSRMTCISADSAWMFVQALLMLYCILPLFCFLPKQSGVIYTGLYLLFVLFLTNCFLCYDVSVFSLLVDTELPLVGAAASLFAFGVENQLLCPPGDPNARFSRSVWYLTPYLCALIQIKTSGVFFVIAAIAILLFRPSIRTNKHRLIQTGIVFGASFVPMILWRIYCAIHFSGLTAKHEGSFSSFLRIFSRKTPDDISTIFFGATKFFFSSTFFIELIVVLAVTMFVTFLVLNDTDFMRSAMAWGFIYLTYFLYTILTIGMYIFSMPQDEAQGLASIDRYQKTVIIYSIYIIICSLFFSLSNFNSAIIRRGTLSANTGMENKTPNKKDFQYARVWGSEEKPTTHGIRTARILTLSCMIFLLIGGWSYKNNWRCRMFYDRYGGAYLVPRLNCEAALKDAGVPERAECVVLTTSDIYQGIYRAMLAFLLGTDRNDVTRIIIESPDQLQQVDEALLRDAWVLVVDDENPLIQSWLDQNESPHIVFVEFGR